MQNGYDPVGYQSNNFDWNLFFQAAITATIDAEIDMDFRRTTKKEFNFESLGLQARKQVFNDIQGDWVSLCYGLNYQFVPKDRLGDVAMTLHDISNFELISSIGREFSTEFDWYFRTFLWGAIGQANKGYPWARADFNIQGKFGKHYILSGGAEGYYGMGREVLINVNAFDSYANVAHRSVDVYAQLSYFSEIWGKTSFRYEFRPYTRSFPEFYNALIISYKYPFSF